MDLGTLGGTSSYAVAVNDNGQVVGTSETRDRDQFGAPLLHAFLWTPTTRMLDIGTLGGTYSYSAAMNDSGQVVGYELHGRRFDSRVPVESDERHGGPGDARG